MWPFGWRLKSSRGFLEVSTRKGPSLTSLSLDWYAGSHLVAVLRSSWATRTLNSSAEDFLAEGAVGRWRSVGREESRGCLWKALLPGGPMLPAHSPQPFPAPVYGFRHNRAVAGFGEEMGRGLVAELYQNFPDSFGVCTPGAGIELPSEPSSLSGVLLGVATATRSG